MRRPLRWLQALWLNGRRGATKGWKAVRPALAMPPISGESRTCRGTTCLPVIREDNNGQGRGRGSFGAFAFGHAFPAEQPGGGHGRGLGRVGCFGGLAGWDRGGRPRPPWLAGYPGRAVCKLVSCCRVTE